MGAEGAPIYIPTSFNLPDSHIQGPVARHRHKEDFGQGSSANEPPVTSYSHTLNVSAWERARLQENMRLVIGSGDTKLIGNSAKIKERPKS